MKLTSLRKLPHKFQSPNDKVVTLWKGRCMVRGTDHIFYNSGTGDGRVFISDKSYHEYWVKNMKFDPQISFYWNSTGCYQKAYETLHRLLPETGSVTGSENLELERLRVASNCYYDLYNNGLANREDEFRDVFGFLPDVATGDDENGHSTKRNKQLERAMDEIVRAAADEQGVDLETGACARVSP